MVIVNTARGPWKICVNMDCPGKEKKPARGAARGKAGAAKKSGMAKKGATKKSTAKKPAAKKANEEDRNQEAHGGELATLPNCRRVASARVSSLGWTDPVHQQLTMRARRRALRTHAARLLSK